MVSLWYIIKRFTGRERGWTIFQVRSHHCGVQADIRGSAHVQGVVLGPAACQPHLHRWVQTVCLGHNLTRVQPISTRFLFPIDVSNFAFCFSAIDPERDDLVVAQQPGDRAGRFGQELPDIRTWTNIRPRHHASRLQLLQVLPFHPLTNYICT